MSPLIATPFLVSGLLCLIGARLGRRLPPAAAAALLTALALITALATGFVLSLAGFLWLAGLPQVARIGHWSPVILHDETSLPGAAGALAGVCAFGLLIAALIRTIQATRAITAAALTCRRLGPAIGGLVVVEDREPTAYALPGFSGRIVVSTAMLRALPADERRALIAHETAHLTRRHHVYIQLTDIAAMANPLLRPLRAAVRLAVERWADEVAATQTGDRRLVARALARAGLARAEPSRADPTRAGLSRPEPLAAQSRSPAVALAAAEETQLAQRIRGLLDPPPPRRRVTSAMVVGLACCCVLTSAEVALAVKNTFETAQAVYVHSP